MVMSGFAAWNSLMIFCHATLAESLSKVRVQIFNSSAAAEVAPSPAAIASTESVAARVFFILIKASLRAVLSAVRKSRTRPLLSITFFGNEINHFKYSIFSLHLWLKQALKCILQCNIIRWRKILRCGHESELELCGRGNRI